METRDNHAPGFFEDPQYRFLSVDFQLPGEQISVLGEIACLNTSGKCSCCHVPHHRFRVAKESWPLVQIGPGLLTLNQTEKYSSMKEFKTTVIDVVTTLAHSYPDSANLLTQVGPAAVY